MAEASMTEAVHCFTFQVDHPTIVLGKTQTIDIDPHGDLRMVTRGNDGADIHFRVSSKVLQDASPFFSSMLDKRWPLAGSLSADNPPFANFHDDDPEALQLILQFFHRTKDASSHKVSDILMRKITFLADKYLCVQAISLWSRRWLTTHLKQCTEKTRYLELACLSYVFKDRDTFFTTTQWILHHCIERDFLTLPPFLDHLDTLTAGLLGMSATPSAALSNSYADTLRAEIEQSTAEIQLSLYTFIQSSPSPHCPQIAAFYTEFDHLRLCFLRHESIAKLALNLQTLGFSLKRSGPKCEGHRCCANRLLRIARQGLDEVKQGFCVECARSGRMGGDQLAGQGEGESCRCVEWFYAVSCIPRSSGSGCGLLRTNSDDDEQAKYYKEHPGKNACFWDLNRKALAVKH
ncbi:MAG: hypothetical protein Q9190_004667 [Brigantiaea leucoxantha]